MIAMLNRDGMRSSQEGPKWICRHKAFRGCVDTIGGMLASYWENNFDLMRLVFASLVVLSHSFELLDGNRDREPLTLLFHTISFGELAVDCFFILSGFLIGASWHRDPNAWRFLRKRILRIYPGFIVAFLVSVYLVSAVGSDQPSTYWHDLRPFALMRQVLLLEIPSTPPTFSSSHYPVVNGALWTISYEFVCYLLIMVLGISGALARSRTPALLWAASLLAFAVLRAEHANDFPMGAITDSHAVTMIRLMTMYLSGTAVCYSGLFRCRARTWFIVIAVVTLLAGLTYKVTAEIAVSSVGAYLLIWLGHLRVDLGVLRRMPDVSYGVYLYGWPLQKLVIASGVTHNPLLVFLFSSTLRYWAAPPVGTWSRSKDYDLAGSVIGLTSARLKRKQ